MGSEMCIRDSKSSFNFFLSSEFSLSALLAVDRAPIAMNGVAISVKTIRTNINSMACLSDFFNDICMLVYK